MKFTSILITAIMASVAAADHYPWSQCGGGNKYGGSKACPSDYVCRRLNSRTSLSQPLSPLIAASDIVLQTINNASSPDILRYQNTQPSIHTHLRRRQSMQIFQPATARLRIPVHRAIQRTGNGQGRVTIRPQATTQCRAGTHRCRRSSQTTKLLGLRLNPHFWTIKRRQITLPRPKNSRTPLTKFSLRTRPLRTSLYPRIALGLGPVPSHL